jgi:glycerol-1-phosphate dehydrogenase [NAD(P)+]
MTLVEALNRASETRTLEIGPGVLRQTPRIFAKHFGQQPALVVADANTFRAAGQAVAEAFRAAQQPMLEPFFFSAPGLYAEYSFVEQLEAALKKTPAIPVAVGSGTINDLTKLAVHRTGRTYIAVATAASMDGYTAFGASITSQGSKQTFLCPAPVAVVADLDVISAAPAEMSAWGYADLIAKVAAGADWILADALGVEAISQPAWDIAQGRLRELVANPAGVRARDPKPIGQLVEGLMLGGFAMQAAKTSRAASGAEHQFSHLWDMQHHKHNGRAPSHGFKVGIGTLASLALYERMLQRSFDKLDIDALCAAWPTEKQWLAEAKQLFGTGEVAEVAAREIAAKAVTPDALRVQLTTLRSTWPGLKEKLRAQLMPFAALKEKLQAAGAPVEPEQIGISRQRLRDSYRQAFFLRRRFTILDMAVRTGVFDSCVQEIFSAQGTWPIN